jgi:uncharacterized membrane protein YbhN (UPF0104 family)
MNQKEGNRTNFILRIATYLLVGLSFFYLFQALWSYRDWLLSWQPSIGNIILLLVLCLIYGVSGFLLSGAWCKLNSICGHKLLSRRECIVVYGTTQIAKYIPGNVFHFLGRHAAGRRIGLSHSTLACSASLEMVGLLFSAGMLSLLGVFVLGPGLKGVLPLPLWLVAAVALGSFLLLAVALPNVLNKMGLPSELTAPKLLMNRLQPVIGQYLVFFIVCSALMVLVCLIVVGSPGKWSLMLVFFSYPVGWLAGYVIPGASAGFGVREATLIVILSALMPPQVATLIAILMRVITVIGDLVFYLMSKIIETGSASRDMHRS